MLAELHQALDGKMDWLLLLCNPALCDQFVFSHMIEGRVVMGPDGQRGAEVLPRVLLVILSVMCLLIGAAGVMYAIADTVARGSFPRRPAWKVGMGSIGVIGITFIFGLGPGSGLWSRRLRM